MDLKSKRVIPDLWMDTVKRIRRKLDFSGPRDCVCVWCDSVYGSQRKQVWVRQCFKFSLTLITLQPNIPPSPALLF